MWLCSIDRQNLFFVLNPQACPPDVFDAAPRRKLDLTDLLGQDLFRCYTSKSAFFMAVYTMCASLPGDWRETLAPLCGALQKGHWYGQVAWYSRNDDVFYADTIEKYGRKDENERWFVDVRKTYAAPAPVQLTLI